MEVLDKSYLGLPDLLLEAIAPTLIQGFIEEDMNVDVTHAREILAGPRAMRYGQLVAEEAIPLVGKEDGGSSERPGPEGSTSRNRH